MKVAGKIAPAIVISFAKGMTLGCMFHLVWHDFAKQRGMKELLSNLVFSPLKSLLWT